MECPHDQIKSLLEKRNGPFTAKYVGKKLGMKRRMATWALWQMEKKGVLTHQYMSSLSSVSRRRPRWYGVIDAHA